MGVLANCVDECMVCRSCHEIVRGGVTRNDDEA